MKNLKSFNRNIKLFILANVFIQIGMGVFSIMYNLYIRELGLPETVNGSVISVTSLATTFGSYWGYAYAFCITGVLYLVASTYFYFIFGRKYALKNEAMG